MTTIQTATVEVFLKAFHGLTRSQRHIFLGELLHEPAYRQDLMDAALVETRRLEPSKSLHSYIAKRSKRK